MTAKLVLTLTLSCIFYQAFFHIYWSSSFPPASWAILSACIWTTCVFVRGWNNLGVWDKRQFLWGALSCLWFLNFLQTNKDFQGWGDVYFFCGHHMEYCTCDFRWNLQGWAKAAVLWNFVLSAALGMQRLAIQLGLNGLLPGEEVVTRESFISICWRLIPYWLNNWEQQWGAECSSMMFELPHFAVELLVILPCVQILCSRMKILAVPHPGLLPHEAEQDPQRENYAPNILKGQWEHSPGQKKFMKRLRSNTRIMTFTVAISALAAFNALSMPLQLERQVLMHPHAASTLLAGRSLAALDTLPTMDPLKHRQHINPQAYINSNIRHSSYAQQAYAQQAHTAKQPAGPLAQQQDGTAPDAAEQQASTVYSNSSLMLPKTVIAQTPAGNAQPRPVTESRPPSGTSLLPLGWLMGLFQEDCDTIFCLITGIKFVPFEGQPLPPGVQLGPNGNYIHSPHSAGNPAGENEAAGLAGNPAKGPSGDGGNHAAGLSENLANGPSGDVENQSTGASTAPVTVGADRVADSNAASYVAHSSDALQSDAIVISAQQRTADLAHGSAHDSALQQAARPSADSAVPSTVSSPGYSSKAATLPSSPPILPTSEEITLKLTQYTERLRNSSSPLNYTVKYLDELLQSDVNAFAVQYLHMYTVSRKKNPPPPKELLQDLKQLVIYPRLKSYAESCPSTAQLKRTLAKHSNEISKMQDPEHKILIPLVESALAVMRLSCEKFFVLVTVFVAYLLFRDPPPFARFIIRLNSRLSTTFQRIILYSFPAVCWIYGAGFIFSTFVSIVFWGGPVLWFYESFRNAISVVCIKSLKPATAAEVERMGGNCAICWGEMCACAEQAAAAPENTDPPADQSQDATAAGADAAIAAIVPNPDTPTDAADTATASTDHTAADSVATAGTACNVVAFSAADATGNVVTSTAADTGNVVAGSAAAVCNVVAGSAAAAAGNVVAGGNAGSAAVGEIVASTAAAADGAGEAATAAVEATLPDATISRISKGTELDPASTINTMGTATGRPSHTSLIAAAVGAAELLRTNPSQLTDDAAASAAVQISDAAASAAEVQNGDAAAVVPNAGAVTPAAVHNEDATTSAAAVVNNGHAALSAAAAVQNVDAATTAAPAGLNNRNAATSAAAAEGSPDCAAAATAQPNEDSAAAQPNQDSATTAHPNQDSAATALLNQDSTATAQPNQDSATTSQPNQDSAATAQPNQDSATSQPNQDSATTAPPNQDSAATAQPNPDSAAAAALQQEAAVPDAGAAATGMAADGSATGAAAEEDPAQVAAAAMDGYSLPCGHAYHHACLTQWLHQCHAQSISPTCPMCQQSIQLEVRWRFPIPWRNPYAALAVGGEQQRGGAAAAGDANVAGLLDHHRELQELLQDMPQIMAPEGFRDQLEVLQQQMLDDAGWPELVPMEDVPAPAPAAAPEPVQAVGAGPVQPYVQQPAATEPHTAAAQPLNLTSHDHHPAPDPAPSTVSATNTNTNNTQLAASDSVSHSHSCIAPLADEDSSSQATPSQLSHDAPVADGDRPIFYDAVTEQPHSSASSEDVGNGSSMDSGDVGNSSSTDGGGVGNISSTRSEDLANGSGACCAKVGSRSSASGGDVGNSSSARRMADVDSEVGVSGTGVSSGSTGAGKEAGRVMTWVDPRSADTAAGSLGKGCGMGSGAGRGESHVAASTGNGGVAAAQLLNGLNTPSSSAGKG